jgi:predicted Fe-Mo cluster-binding NifX family protein
MKIAAITEDGKTISLHFGRAPFYMVLTVEDGKITGREMREKLGHNQFAADPNMGYGHGQGNAPGAEPGAEQQHGYGATAHDKHTRMAANIADCEALLCRGMGAGAYQSMITNGIRPVMTDIELIDEAVQAYLEGKIVDRVDLLH